MSAFVTVNRPLTITGVREVAAHEPASDTFVVLSKRQAKGVLVDHETITAPAICSTSNAGPGPLTFTVKLRSTRFVPPPKTPPDSVTATTTVTTPVAPATGAKERLPTPAGLT